MFKTKLAAATVALAAGSCLLPLRAGDGPTSGPAQRAPRSRPARSRHRFTRTRLTPERVAEITAFAREHMPFLYERIRQYQKERPEQAPRALRWAGWVMHQVLRYPPEGRPAAIGRYRVLYEIRQTVREIGRTENAREKAQLEERLERLLGEQFDYDQTLKEYEVKRLAKRLAELKAEIQQRRRNRRQVIAEAFRRLLRPPGATRPARSERSGG